MTPYERILRNKGMQEFAFEKEKPAAEVSPFPRNNAGLTVVMLCVLPLFFKATLAPTPMNILGYGVIVCGFGLGIWLLSKGLKLQDHYKAAQVARAPVLPFKLLGSGIIGATSAGLTWFQAGDIAQSLVVLAVMSGLCAVAFGRDPSTHKGLETPDQRDAHKLDDVSARVGKHMERVREAASIHADPDVMPRIRAFDDAVDGLLKAAMHDPERIGTLRKYFGVYLDGAAEASERFASVFTGTGDPGAKQKYLGVIEKLTRAFSLKAHEYAKAGKMKLDVQIDVLDNSLSQEVRSAG